jgi:hypothetical protein
VSAHDLDPATIANIVQRHEALIARNPALRREWYIFSVSHRLRKEMTEDERRGLLAAQDVPFSEPARSKRIQLADNRLYAALRAMERCDETC